MCSPSTVYAGMHVCTDILGYLIYRLHNSNIHDTDVCFFWAQLFRTEEMKDKAYCIAWLSRFSQSQYPWEWAVIVVNETVI